MRLAAIDARAHLVVPHPSGADPTGAHGVVDLARHGMPEDPMEVIARWPEVKAWALRERPVADGPLDEAALSLPVPWPSQVFAVGLNYVEHAAELHGGRPVPTEPMVFTKFPSCLAGPRDDIPLVDGFCDWEVELVLVVGAGCCVGQDVSERVRQMQGSPPQFSLSKSFAGFGPIGPWVTDEVDPSDLAISCSLNGEVVQAARTSEMVFGPQVILDHLASVCELRPGDLVFTGTPPGVGSGRTPPRALQPGDVVVSTIEGIGSIVNRCR